MAWKHDNKYGNSMVSQDVRDAEYPRQRPQDAQGRMTEGKKDNRLGVAGWIAIVVLAAFLVVSLVYAIHAWTALSGVAMSGMGWLFLGLGVVVTIAVGGGLMALVFYSSRHDYDR